MGYLSSTMMVNICTNKIINIHHTKKVPYCQQKEKRKKKFLKILTDLTPMKKCRFTCKLHYQMTVP